MINPLPVLAGAVITLVGTFAACVIIAVVAYALRVASRLFRKE